MAKKKTRPVPPPSAPPPGDTWKECEIVLQGEGARVEISLPGGGGVIVYDNGYVERWG